MSYPAQHDLWQLGAAKSLVHAGRRGKGALRFELDGQDLTKADKRLTDAEIARHFPLDLFERAVFYGQTEVSALLEVNLPIVSDAHGISARLIC